MKPSFPYMDSLYSFAHQYHRFYQLSMKSDDIYETAGQIKILMDNITRHYKKRLLPKRNSKEKRVVFEVSDFLKSIQEFIKITILDPLDRVYTADYAFAYRKGLSARDNAQVHAGCRYMLKLDIRHFFESIRKSLVYSMLRRHTPYNRSVLGMLTRLLCYDTSLCQGACTSPQIANLVLADFDNLISIFCMNSGIAYSRYCDDMTFSSIMKFDMGLVKDTVTLLLSSYHFELNEKKTRVLGPGQRREVTGAVVNDRVRAKRIYRQEIRKELYYIRKFGVADHLEKTRPEWYRSPCTDVQIRHYLFSLRGRISYVMMLWPEDPFVTWAVGEYRHVVCNECSAFSRTTIRGLIPLLGPEDKDLFSELLMKLVRPDRRRAAVPGLLDLPREDDGADCTSSGSVEDDGSVHLPFDVMGYDDPPLSTDELLSRAAQRLKELSGLP